MGTSSADPFALSQYASDGLALVAALEGDSDALTAALSALRSSASPFVPYLGDAGSVQADLVGDWQHLDESAGDVANGFFAANPELSEHGMRDGIVLRPNVEPSNNSFSLLVRFSALPADVLVDVANVQLDDMLRLNQTPWTQVTAGDPWGIGGSTTEVNVLTALCVNGDASLAWLGTEVPGRHGTNLERLLRYNPHTDDPALGGALAHVVDSGLQHPDFGRSDALFEIAVDTIGDQDMVNFGDQMLPVLGEGARTHMDQLAARTNEVMSGTPGRPDQDSARALYNVYYFLEEVMADDTAANSVYRGGWQYVQDVLGSDTGDGFGGESRRIGGLMGLITEADENVVHRRLPTPASRPARASSPGWAW